MRLLAIVLALAPPAAGLPQAEKSETGLARARAARASADPALQELLARYETKETEFPWKLQPLREGEKFELSWLTFPSPVRGDVEENNTDWARFWRPKDEEKRRPAALVLHWLGGSFDALDLVCQRLAESGVAALMMYMPHYGPRRAKAGPGRQELMTADMEKTLSNIRQAVMDARRAGDWLASRPDVDPARVGIVGISLGAVIGSLAAGVDGGFGRSVFLIGGGDPAAIVMHGSKEMAEAKKRLEEAGHTLEKLRAHWRDIDPCTFASRMRPEEILMINADADEVIPRAATEKLHEAIGRPELRWFKGGHYALALRLGPVLKEITEHLRQRTP